MLYQSKISLTYKSDYAFELWESSSSWRVGLLSVWSNRAGNRQSAQHSENACILGPLSGAALNLVQSLDPVDSLRVPLLVQQPQSNPTPASELEPHNELAPTKIPVQDSFEPAPNSNVVVQASRPGLPNVQPESVKENTSSDLSSSSDSDDLDDSSDTDGEREAENQVSLISVPEIETKVVDTSDIPKVGANGSNTGIDNHDMETSASKDVNVEPNTVNPNTSSGPSTGVNPSSSTNVEASSVVRATLPSDKNVNQPPKPEIDEIIAK
ncbi:hypothetical protein FRC07_004536 [Ceratobasidium sp. 392]|nr:hypothetical protein FRC07_004536 [Ceratobasidium sp. 392]